jgi:hypothetical protein
MLLSVRAALSHEPTCGHLLPILQLELGVCGGGLYFDLCNMELISPTSFGRSVGIVRSRTQATECSLVCHVIYELGAEGPM